MSKLQALHDLLRDETKWPEGFKWDYALNTKCALGLAERTGLVCRDQLYSPATFDLTQRDWFRIFQTPLGNRYRFNENNWAKVKPSTVALRIKRHLKAQAT